MNLVDAYSEKYISEKKHDLLYPTEFIVRTFLGKHQWSHLIPTAASQARLLDLSAGDGRNTGFFLQQGYSVCVSEIGNEICEVLDQRFQKFSNYKGSFAVYPERLSEEIFPLFDMVVACHSLYYIGSDSSIEKNLAGVHSVLNDGGHVLASFVTPNNYYFSDTNAANGDYLVVNNDPLEIRNGATLYAPSDKASLSRTLSKFFKIHFIKRMSSEYPGVTEDIWWVLMTKS